MSTAYLASSLTEFGTAVATAAATLAAALIFGLVNVWVLLVEILR